MYEVPHVLSYPLLRTAAHTYSPRRAFSSGSPAQQWNAEVPDGQAGPWLWRREIPGPRFRPVERRGNARRSPLLVDTEAATMKTACLLVAALATSPTVLVAAAPVGPTGPCPAASLAPRPDVYVDSL
ncbi:hypothetical protein TCAP_05145 [Tolypocladium capitatum]|uniref:Uncharacterized protein n=1 Tax=Tolypocladium capitatum TaxID=45235 RepID=A0A2K3QBN9_9HYPO|nr:hypothetical protein TCAP_05145 [Tolypocladium capitatum]